LKEGRTTTGRKLMEPVPSNPPAPLLEANVD
jgi:hypothetical protein